MELAKKKKEAVKKHGKHSRKALVCYKTNHTEIYALIGLFIKLGVTGFNTSSIKEIFSTKKSAYSLDAHITFSRPRFEILNSCLRFDQKDNRPRNPDGSLIDIFVHIREVSL